VFNQLVALLQKKLGLPVSPPDVPIANLKLQDHDVPKGWTLETKPGADASRHEVTLEGPDGIGSLFIGAYSLETAERARTQEGELRKRLEKGATRVEILPLGRTVLALALYGKAVGIYERVAEELRQCMGLASRSWEILVPAPAELPEGYAIDKIETDVKTVFQLSGIEGARESEVRHAWHATLKPQGVIVLFEAEDSTVRGTLKDHLAKRGPAWDLGSWACGVGGPDDVALDAIENRMREKFGWERNQPRPLQLLSARLTPSDLPAGFELADETVDRKVFACTIRTPQGPLHCKIQQTFDYGLTSKVQKELPYVPGDLVLIKDTIVAYVGGPEDCWPALDKLEVILRKKMRLGVPEILEYALLPEQLPQGSLYLDRPPQNTPNPRMVKHTSPEVTGWWQGVVDPSETRIEIFQLRDAAAARAWEASILEARKKPEGRTPAHAATFTRGPIVISLEQQKPGETVFAALSEIARGKLRLKKP
jgi:hypothetical protein